MSALQRHELVSEVVEGGHEDEAGDGGGLGLRVGEGAGGDGGAEGVSQHQDPGLPPHPGPQPGQGEAGVLHHRVLVKRNLAAVTEPSVVKS